MTIRLGISLGLLLGLAWLVDLEAVASRFRQLHGGWAGTALLISVVQVAASAWRWRFTARRLGIELPYAHALREYYRASFLNQVLPGGVLGDVSRAWRHARADVPTGPAVRAVILERVSGQVVMMVATVLSLAALPVGTAPIRSSAAIGAAVLAVASVFWWTRSRTRAASPIDRLLRELNQALLAGRALPIQFVTSTLVVATYLAIYVCAARAVDVRTPAAALLPLVPPVLMAMLIPVSIAGWGVREGAAAALWTGVGLTAADGVAVSLAYGLLVFVSTLPGAVMLIRPGDPVPPGGPAGARSRTARPRRGGSDDRAGAAPGRAR